MRKLFVTLATAVLCSMMGSAIFISCNKNDDEDEIQTEDYPRGLYSDLVPDDGSNSSVFGITDEDLALRAQELGVEVAALKAVWKVETGGISGFLPNYKPVILFEGHIFWQQLRVRGIMRWCSLRSHLRQ